MLKSMFRAVAAVAFCVASVGSSEAAASVLVDQGASAASSPYVFTTQSGQHPGVWSSQYDFQEFFVRAVVTENVVVRGMTIYSGAGWADVGTAATLRIFGDESGSMGAEIAQRVGTIDGNADTDWDFPLQPAFNIKTAHAAFGDVNLAAGTYWFSMSGWEGADLSWASFVEEGAPKTRFDQTQLGHGVYEVGDEVLFDHTTMYRLPFLVDGETAGVPEPTTWALMIAGLGLAGAALRRRQLASGA